MRPGSLHCPMRDIRPFLISRLFELYAGKTREEAEDLAVEISSIIADRIAPWIDGYYLMTPFLRTSLMTRIIEHIKTQKGIGK